MQELKERTSDLHDQPARRSRRRFVRPEARHAHAYQWKDDPGVLRDFAEQVAWPTDIPPQLSGLTRCPTCGAVDLVHWTRPPCGEIPRSLSGRLAGYALAQDATVRCAPSCQLSGLSSR